jgi:3-oxoacyl-[acyl-carrier protein] reductase
MNHAKPFDGKVVLVTGGSQGIGAAVAAGFAAAGARGTINYFPDSAGANAANAAAVAARINAEAGTEAFVATAADVRDTAGVAAMMEQIRARFGRLDVLVNNAGILRDRTLSKMTDDEWQAVIDTNLSGVFRVSRAALPLLADEGRIVSISSVAGQIGIFGQTNYAAAKAGVVGFTKALAKEVARRRITVNAVAPGLVNTTMAESIPAEARAALEKQIPLGRLAEPADIVNAVMFLAHPASGYITGQTLNVNGGWYA